MQALKLLIAALISFGITCLAVFLFSLQFQFEWSILLCVCVWLGLAFAKWLLGND